MNFLKSLTASVLLLNSGLSAAVELSILPSAVTVQQGNSVSVDLVASDLGSFSAPSLGAFLVEIIFNDAILDFDAVVYGSLLGNPGDPLETSIVTTTGIGSVSLDEFSFLLDVELDALQPDSFTLATLTFSGQTVGTSALSIGTVDLADAVGNTLTPTALNAGSIQVTSAGKVPVPATAALILPFALLLAARSRRSHC
jgi:hypothetical protein